ncbi:f-box wd repeat-containing protein 9-like protein [Lasius niger]|uniref:F-box wd repeat-containing protein 9-like protein n=1 Tax=Lasius niger TaxID=67767 RepID=A0A0J7L5Y0_LASNI|nr:f-box wd repeat-containing protein 9-like protein [Lasius niger]
MDDENASCAHNSEEDAQVSLLDLPVEIFLHICSFLKASTLVHSLSLVCKQFYLILKDDSLWKARINRMWPDASYPLLRPAKPDKLFWKLSCVAIEKQRAIWGEKECSMKQINSHSCGSTVDALLLMHDGTAYIAGARDRSLIYRNFAYKGTIGYKESITNIVSAHNGWIWDLTTIDNTIYSCSWDQSIKSWLLSNIGLVQQKTYKMNASGALLCMSSCPEQSLFATGSYLRTVFIFDSRSGEKPIRQYRPHGGAVIKLAMNSEYILSASEDKTVSVWDQRAGRIMKYITIPGEAFPMCMNMQQDCVCIGDSVAKLHVLNPKKDFELVNSYSTGHTKGITGVHLTHGNLITSSTDGTVRISSPTDPPKPMATLCSSFGEIARMDYQNGILAISGSEIVVYESRCVQ